MKKLILIPILLLFSLTTNAQLGHFVMNFDSVTVIKWFKIINVKDAVSNDSLMAKRPNGNFTRVSQSKFATAAALGGYVPTSRTITINGSAFDLTANRSFSVGTVTAITPGWGFTSATPIRTNGTLTIDTSKAQSVDNFFPKGDTRYLKATSTINQGAKVANYTITSADFSALKQPELYLTFDCSSGNLIATLPSATTFAGYRIYLSKIDNTTNVLTISGLAADNKIGSPNWVKELISVSGNWVNN